MRSIRRERILRPLLAAVAAFAFGTARAAEDSGRLTATRILDDTRVIDVAITLPQDDWDTLRNQSRDMGRAIRGETTSPFTWFRADVTVDGVAIGTVGLRKKGFLGSLDSASPSLLVDFNRFVDAAPVEGMTRLTLNNNKQDSSLVRQSLTYRVFRAAGVAAPRVGFADVTVNGERLGIYSNVEAVRRPFLAAAFGDGAGTLWEGTVCDVVPQSLERLEVEREGDPGDLVRMAELADVLAADAPLDMTRLAGIVDLDHFLRFWALESLVNAWDGYSANQNNYFVYAAPGDGLLRFVPWGADATFGPTPGFGGGPFAPRRRAPAVFAQAALPNRLYFTPGVAGRYRDALEAVMHDAWREDDLLAECDRLEGMLAPRAGPRQRNVAKGIEGVREFVRGRRAEVEEALADWPVEAPSTWRRPMGSRPLGVARGTFSVTYRDGAVDDVPPGEVDLEVVIDDAAVELRDVEASASTFVLPGSAGDGQGGAPVSVVISAIRAADGKPLTLNLFLDRRRVGSDESVPVNGVVTEGTAGFGIPGLVPMRTIDGRFSPSERGLSPGEVLAGRLDLELTQLDGGLMNPAAPARPAADAAEDPAPQEPAAAGS